MRNLALSMREGEEGEVFNSPELVPKLASDFYSLHLALVRTIDEINSGHDNPSLGEPPAEIDVRVHERIYFRDMESLLDKMRANLWLSKQHLEHHFPTYELTAKRSYELSHYLKK